MTTDALDLLAFQTLARTDFYWFSRYMFYKRRNYKWMHNWHHDEICKHLQSVYDGDTTRLIINIPPRYSKTELVIVNFIAWCMGKTPDSEFIYTSYSADLAHNYNAQARDLIKSEAYQELFPDTQVKTDQDAKGHWGTTKGGVSYSAGVGGTMTGYGAGKMRETFGGCFDYNQQVETEYGAKKIGDIVTSGAPIKVWSYNEKLKAKELREVSDFWSNGQNDMLQINMSDGTKIKCTPDHEILTKAGWVSAIHFAYVLNLMNAETGQLASLGAGETSVIGNINDALRVLWFTIPLSVRQMLSDASPCLSYFDLSYNSIADTVTLGQGASIVSALEYLNGLFSSEDSAGSSFEDWECAVPESVLHIVGLSAIREIAKGVVGGVAIEVPNFILMGSFAYKLLSDKVRDIASSDSAINGQTNSKVSFPVTRGLKRSNGLRPSDFAKIGDLVKPVGVSDSFPVSVEYVGHVSSTYCLSVRGNSNFILSQNGAIVSNCILVDDPHKASEARSKKRRQNVQEWFAETLKSRLNDPIRTPMIIIMQRLHEDDLTGWLMTGNDDDDWKLVKMPALQPDGTALWPAKHDVTKLKAMQEAQPYMFAGQYQQEPTPGEGGEFKVGMIEIVDALPATANKSARGWDLASTLDDGDYTAGVKIWQGGDGYFYVEDVERGQWDSSIVRSTIKLSAQLDGKLTAIRLPQDPGQAGKDQAKSYTRLLAGYNVAVLPVSGDKITRAEPFAAQVNAGNVRLIKGDWNKAYIDELKLFPLGTNDDQVDGSADAFNHLFNFENQDDEPPAPIPTVKNYW